MTAKQAKLLNFAPWPFTSVSYLPVERKWAATLLQLFRKHDREKAKKHWKLMQRWRAIINAPSGAKEPPQ